MPWYLTTKATFAGGAPVPAGGIFYSPTALTASFLTLVSGPAAAPAPADISLPSDPTDPSQAATKRYVDAAIAAAVGSFRYRGSVGHRVGSRTWAGASRKSAAYTGLTTTYSLVKSVHYSGPQAICGLEVGYHNIDFGPPEMPCANAITVSCSIMLASGLIYPAFKNGSRTITLSPGAVTYFDAVGVYVPAQTAYTIITYVLLASTSADMPLNGKAFLAGDGLSYGATAPGSDPTLTNFTPTLAGNLGIETYSPINVIGRTAKPQHSVLMVGDSRMVGFGEATTGSAQGEQGWAERALSNKVPWCNMSVCGFEIVEWLTQAIDSLSAYDSNQPAFTTLLDNLAINDINGGTSLAVLQSYKTGLWSAAQARGMNVWVSTVEPYTTGTWTSAGGQTPAANTGPNSVRTQYNDWLRSLPAGITGVLDVAALVETATDSGIWISPGGVAYTNDGLHENAAGAAFIAANLNVAGLL